VLRSVSHTKYEIGTAIFSFCIWPTFKPLLV
jgi:hypothetical protein